MKDFEYTISKFGRGTCPEKGCGRFISLTKAGKVRIHGAKAGWPPVNCPGSGKPPRKA